MNPDRVPPPPSSLTDPLPAHPPERGPARAYPELFQASTDAIFIHDPDTGAILDVNDSMLALYGFGMEEALRLKPEDCCLGVSPWTGREFQERISAAVHEGPQFFEWQARRKGGEPFWVEISLRAAPIGDNLRVVAFVRDITGRKRALRTLEASNQRLRLTMSSVKMGTWEFDFATRSLRWSDEVFEILGIPPAPVSYEFLVSLVHPDDRHIPKAAMERAVATRSPYFAQYRMASGDSTRWVEDRGEVSFAPDGTPLLATGVALDITERQLADAALRKEESFRQSVIERASEGLCVCHAIPEFPFVKFTVWNERMTQITGYSLGEINRLGWYQTVYPDPEYRERAIRRMDEMRQGRDLIAEEWEITRADRQKRTLAISTSALPDDDGIVHVLGLMSDVTERRRLESQMLRKQRLESIGTLAGGVAHDLNNALAPILLVTEMLRSEYPGESETVELVETSARRGAEMVRQLLTFARGVEVERRRLQPLQLFQELERIIRSTFPKNIRLQTRYSPQLRTLVGDAAQLHQVLLNFCVNARDAMPHGGTLTLEAENADIDALFASNISEAVPGPHVVCRVRDTGVGIPPEHLERIFDPFFSTKGPDRGTGLGLSTALGIVRSHGGFIQVESAPDLGSCFSAYLPAANSGADLPETSPPSRIACRGNGETILLVDDEAPVREAGCAVLRRLNYRPLSATDGADGIARAGQHVHELDAVITDLHMPYLDGLAFVRVIRKMLPTVPIAVATGRIESSAMREFEALGVRHWLNKPFSESQLAETLRSMLTSPN